MAERDAGLDKLEALIVRLDEYGKQMTGHLRAIDSLTEKLGEVDDDAEDALGKLQKEVEDIQEELNESESAALNEVWDLTGEARDIAHERLKEALEELTEAGDRFEAKVDEDGTELDSARQDLLSEGFDVADKAFDDAEDEYKQDRQEVESAFDTLREGIAESAKNLDEAVDGMAAKVAEATKEVTDRETALETEAKDSADAFESKGAEFTGKLDKVSTAAGTLYDSVDEGVDTTGNYVEALVESGCNESGDWAKQAGEQLGEAAEQASDAQTAHGQELETLESALVNVGALATEFDRLSDDLRRCAQIMEKIDELLDAMKT